MIKFFLFTLLILTLPHFSQAEGTDGSEKFVVLPLLGYSDEQGLGLGANAAWLNIQGSSWSIDTALFTSALYSQTFLSGQLTNPKLFDFLYTSFGGFINRSKRNLFYGLGNATSLVSTTQYSISDTYYFARLGFHVYSDLVFGVGYSHRNTALDHGADPLLPQYQDIYPTDPLNAGTATTATSLFLLYDTRAPYFAPQSGTLFFASLEQAQPTPAEVLSEQRFILIGENYYTISDKELILALRAKFDHQWGENIPFFLKPSIGGATNLRAFRSNRFIDNASVLFNIEPRWTFWTLNGSLFERFELSFAQDLGRVYDYENPPPLDSYHIGYDVGLTAILAGGVPLRFDYATGPEGHLFYLHLFYPF